MFGKIKLSPDLYRIMRSTTNNMIDYLEEMIRDKDITDDTPISEVLTKLRDRLIKLDSQRESP